MWARRHQHEYGSTCEDLGQIVITQRTHAGRNEHALRREPLTMDDYLGARWINEPFRVLDCTSKSTARCDLDYPCGHRAQRQAAARVVVRIVELPKRAGWTEWDDPTEMFSRTAGPKIWDKPD